MHGQPPHPSISLVLKHLWNLSSTSRQRYVEKVILAGLSKDPYSLIDEQWENTPENLPSISAAM